MSRAQVARFAVRVLVAVLVVLVTWVLLANAQGVSWNAARRILGPLTSS